MADSTTESLRTAFGAGALAFGAFGTLAPSAFVAAYGMTSSPSTNIFVRLFGTRNLVLGALTVGAEDDETRRRLLALSTAMNIVDTVLVATAGGLPGRVRARGAVTTALFAGLGGYLVSQG